MAKIFWKLDLRLDNLAGSYHPLQFRSVFLDISSDTPPLLIIIAMSLNASRRDREARARMQVYIGDVPGTMTPLCVALHLEMNGYAMPHSVLLNGMGTDGLMQEGVVTFYSEADATILRQAGGQNRRALRWSNGRCALIRPALRIGIIPGDRHHKAGGYAAQKASKRQFCG